MVRLRPAVRRRSLRGLTLLAALAAGAAGVACGDPVDVASQPHIGGERFIDVTFDDVYRPPGAAVDEAATVDLVQTESLSLAGGTPESVLMAYGEAMGAAGWEAVEEPQENRDGSWFGSWRRLGRNLVVTAAVGTPDEEGAEPPVDFVLSFLAPQGPDRITGVEQPEVE